MLQHGQLAEGATEFFRHLVNDAEVRLHDDYALVPMFLGVAEGEVHRSERFAAASRDIEREHASRLMRSALASQPDRFPQPTHFKGLLLVGFFCDEPAKLLAQLDN